MGENNSKSNRVVYCVGNNLATLVGAFESARAGAHVKLFTDGGTLGGFFSGITIEGYNFDLGMVLLEKSSVPASSGSNMRSSMNAWLLASEQVSNWLDDQGPLIRLDTPEVLINGQTHPDYVMSNRLDLLQYSQVALATTLSATSPYHAANKELGTLYDDLTYAEASKRNHGHDFHEKYIEPLINKITGLDSSCFLARFHRFSWAPLYYPETINSAIRGLETGLAEYEFWTTSSGFTGDLIRGVKEKLSKLSNVEIIEKKLTSLSFGKGTVEIDGKKFSTGQKVLFGLGMNRSLQLLDSPHNSNSSDDSPVINFSVGLAIVHRSEIHDAAKALFIVDNEYGSYRFTNQDAIAGLNPEWHRISIEANTSILQRKYDAFSIDDALEADLRKFLKIRNSENLKMLKILHVKNALMVPSKENVAYKHFLSTEITSLTRDSAILSGDLLGFGSSSVNNQVLQGLRYREGLS